MNMLKIVRNNNFTRPKFIMAENAGICIYDRKDIICILPYKNRGTKHFQQKLVFFADLMDEIVTI